MSTEISERQALSNLIRCSRSREPIMTHDSLSVMSLFPTVSCRRSGNLLKRLRSCVGMSKLLEWFLLFLATMASSHAEDRRLAKDGGEVRIYKQYTLITCDARLSTSVKRSLIEIVSVSADRHFARRRARIAPLRSVKIRQRSHRNHQKLRNDASGPLRDRSQTRTRFRQCAGE